jgi:hypothetical protein
MSRGKAEGLAFAVDDGHQFEGRSAPGAYGTAC